MTKTAMLGVGLCLGFGMGCAASHWLIPPARAGTNPPRFEYTCIWHLDTGKGSIEELNHAGAEGWEMVAAVEKPAGDLWCFKRPLLW